MRIFLCLLVLLACSARAQEPLRVISLAPSMTDIMLELQADDLLVGVLDGGERPAGLRALPSVGRQGQLDMERLLSLRPDLVLVWPSGVSPAQQAQLKRLGIETFSAEPHSLDQLIEQIEAIADRIGRGEQGLRYGALLRDRLQQLRQRYRREQPVSVFYQVWDTPLYTVGATQIISDALAVCGARNVFDDINLPAPQISVEAVLQRDPQVILAGDWAQLARWKAWPRLRAVAGKRLLVVPDKGLERPSGQMIDATKRLCALLEARAPD
ncbi:MULTISPECIES: cobalamin-binding protein [Pseudomonas]|uniref:Cobalamin-binding protein n=1 Tax=Pseudomonas taiwanensis TaxID=470150 RepID=A0ABR6VDK7_9PSED|nr:MULTISPECIES: cobalamin-binding protein [Pseudomonas]AGZ37296.1 periplasmic binding protein [Pseudomonas sp. VLB120]MBC3478494.1 cobalamin-binding protein [Pseudomonas taiwanensis]MBC3493186.1 cobalamin-binding protein [Pseudomonas taiwanensis]